MNGAQERLERVVTPIPGPRSRALAGRLATYEARGVTYLSASFPVFWADAHGALIVDVDGNRYLDLTAAFGVANVGHGNPRVAAAVAAQTGRLIHAMGDVHPTEAKAALLERLAAVTPGDLQKTYLTTGGAEAIEFALKTAALATGKPHVLAYHGAYHGLSLGTLDVIGIAKFREPFAALVGERTTWLRYPGGADSLPAALAAARAALAADRRIGALIVEPVQGRGGVIVPPDGFLGGLRGICDEQGVLLICDEIYTGFGRTGFRFACEREGVVPDLLCIGKALGGGVPIGATVGRPAVMDAWPASTGEALHTATFIGNPLACVAALATLDEFERLDLVARVRAGTPAFEARVRRFLAHRAVVAVRGVGYLRALECATAAVANRVVEAALARGVIVLQTGPAGTAVGLSPPLTIEAEQLERALDLLEACVAEVTAG